MPFINDRYCMNPVYGRALERARAADDDRLARRQNDARRQDEGGHWVTIDQRHVLIHDARGARLQQGVEPAPHRLSTRDKVYLDKYYDAVAELAKEYDVDPALVLELGAESGFASAGTYLKTGDALGMTGGNTKHMTGAASPAENAQKFFKNYGEQIRGAGSDTSRFIHGLQGRNEFGKPVKGWKVYNSVRPVGWERMARDGIDQMLRDIPAYLSQRTR